MSQPLATPFLQQEKKSNIFYKLIVASSLQDRKLRIPDKFVQKFGDELASMAKLTIPNGHMWLVELKKHNHKLWFDNGWHEFVKHCSINIGYFLIFRCQGDSTFNVYIFDLASSEIEYPWNTLSSLQEPDQDKQWLVPIEKDKVNNCLEVSPSFSPFLALSSLNKKVLDEGVSYKCNKDLTSGVKLEYLDLTEEVHNLEASYQFPRDKGIQFKSDFANALEEVGLHFNCGTKRKITDSGQITDSCKHGAELSTVRISFTTYSRRWRPVATEEKKRTARAAEMFKSDNPFFRVILRPSYVYKALLLHIPATFARKYLNGFIGFITLLDCNGNGWLVRCVSHGGRAKFSKGWPEFVWGNNLDESDVCIFELINTNNMTLKVTIFRVLQDTEPARQPESKTFRKVKILCKCLVGMQNKIKKLEMIVKHCCFLCPIW